MKRVPTEAALSSIVPLDHPFAGPAGVDPRIREQRLEPMVRHGVAL